MKTLVCQCCHHIFNTETTAEEVDEQYLKEYGKKIQGCGEQVIVCSRCKTEIDKSKVKH